MRCRYIRTLILVWVFCQHVTIFTAGTTAFSFKNVSRTESQLSCHKSNDMRPQPDSLSSKKNLCHNNQCKINEFEMDSESSCCDFTCNPCCFAGFHMVIPDPLSKTVFNLSSCSHHVAVVTTPQVRPNVPFHPPRITA